MFVCDVLNTDPKKKLRNALISIEMMVD